VFDAAYGMAGRFGYLDKYMLVASESRGDQSGGLKGRRRGRSLDWPAIRAASLLPCGLMWLAGMVLSLVTCSESVSALEIMRLRC
jgi:hypothetical protein